MGVYLVDQIADLIVFEQCLPFGLLHGVFLEFCNPLLNARPLRVQYGFPRARRVIHLLVLLDVRHVESSQKVFGF